MEQDHSGSSSDASRRPSPTGQVRGAAASGRAASPLGLLPPRKAPHCVRAQVATHLVTPAAAAAGGLTRAESISPSAQGAVAAANGKPQLNGLRQAAAASPPEPGGQPHRAAQGQPSPLGRSATLQAQALAGVGGGGTDAARSPDLLADAGAPAAPDQRPEGAATDLQMQGAQGPMVEPVLASAASQLQGSARARRGSWYTTSTLSRAMSSFKETMTEAQVPSLKLREGGDAAAAAPSGGQVVQVRGDGAWWLRARAARCGGGGERVWLPACGFLRVGAGARGLDAGRAREPDASDCQLARAHEHILLRHRVLHRLLPGGAAGRDHGHAQRALLQARSARGPLGACVWRARWGLHRAASPRSQNPTTGRIRRLAHEPNTRTHGDMKTSRPAPTRRRPQD